MNNQMEDVLKQEIKELKEQIYSAELEIENLLSENANLELTIFRLEEELRLAKGEN